MSTGKRQNRVTDEELVSELEECLQVSLNGLPDDLPEEVKDFLGSEILLKLRDVKETK